MGGGARQVDPSAIHLPLWSVNVFAFVVAAWVAMVTWMSAGDGDLPPESASLTSAG